MPAFLLPRNVSAHRLAATALYRSLLRQCRSAPAALAERRDELQNIVRNRFKQAQHVHSHRRLRLAFQAGYEAIDHLDAAVAGDGDSTEYILDLVRRAPAKVKAPPPPRRRQSERKRPSEMSIANNVPGAGALETELAARPRPLADLAGRRKVPVLYSANRIPVLRFRKPQPHALSRFIAQRVERRQRRFDRRDWLLERIGLARAEDEWDELVSARPRPGLRGRGGSGDVGLADAVEGAASAGAREVRKEPSWRGEFEAALGVVEEAVAEEGRRNAEMAARMQGLVDREREVFERERDERRAEARERRRTKRAAGADVTREKVGGAEVD